MNKKYKYCEICEYFMDEKTCGYPEGCGCCACSGVAHEYDMYNEFEGCNLDFVKDKEKPDDKKEKNDSKE